MDADNNGDNQRLKLTPGGNDTDNVPAEAAFAETTVAHTFNPSQHQDGFSPSAAATLAVPYAAPVIHAVADAELPIVHDPHNSDALDVMAGAQAAQAIAASAPAYNIPTTGVLADDVAYYAVNRAHDHAYHANSAISGSAHPSATSTAGREYMAQTAPAPGASAAAAMDVYADTAHDRARAQARQAHPTQAKYQATQLKHRQEARRKAIPATAFLQHCTNGRQTMNILLQEQKQALADLNLAEEEVARAQDHLAKAKQHKTSVDERIKANTESLTEELIKEKTRWNDMYQRLVEYKKEHGHCHVMRNPKRNKSVAFLRKKNSSEEEVANLQSLGTWVGQVRLDARRPTGHPDRLEPYKVVALDRLGFDWEPRENYWMDMFEQLKTYLEKNGGRMPPRFISNKKFALGQWCDTQLDNYRKFNGGKKGAYITQDKINMLNDIGFVWDKRGHMWRENYDRLKEFKQKHGHCNATASNNGGDKSFGTWVTKQKRKYANWKRGETKSQEISLTNEQATLMDAIGFGESVDVDGRKIRPNSNSSNRPKKMAKPNPPNNGTIAGLVNASAEIEEKVEDRNGQHEHQEAISQSIGDNGEQVDDENYNTNNIDATGVANSWGDSANAVSLLVDAIMNKESQPVPSDTPQV